MPANLENSAVATGLKKVSFHSNPLENQCQECSNYCTIALISHTSKVMLKILQARPQQCMNCELPDGQAGFPLLKRQRNQRSICQHPLDHQKSKRVPKNIYFCFIDLPKPLTVWITINCGKFERDANNRPPDLPLEKPICRSGSNS